MFAIGSGTFTKLADYRYEQGRKAYNRLMDKYHGLTWASDASKYRDEAAKVKAAMDRLKARENQFFDEGGFEGARQRERMRCALRAQEHANANAAPKTPSPTPTSQPVSQPAPQQTPQPKAQAPTPQPTTQAAPQPKVQTPTPQPTAHVPTETPHVPAKTLVKPTGRMSPMQALKSLSGRGKVGIGLGAAGLVGLGGLAHHFFSNRDGE